MPTLEGCMRWQSWPCCWWWSAEPSSSLDGGLLPHGGSSSESRGWRHHRWWWRAALWCTQTWPRRCGSIQRWLWTQTPEPPWRSRQQRPWGAGESDSSWCGRSWDGPRPGSSPGRCKQWGEVVPPGSRHTENCSTSGRRWCATGGSCTARTGQKPRRPSPWRWGWAWRRRWGWRGSPLCVSGAAPREQQHMQDTRPESRERWEKPRPWCPRPCPRSVQTRPLKARWSWRLDSESEDTRGGTFLTGSDALIYPSRISDNLKINQECIRCTWSDSKVVFKMSQVFLGLFKEAVNLFILWKKIRIWICKWQRGSFFRFGLYWGFQKTENQAASRFCRCGWLMCGEKNWWGWRCFLQTLCWNEVLFRFSVKLVSESIFNYTTNTTFFFFYRHTFRKIQVNIKYKDFGAFIPLILCSDTWPETHQEHQIPEVPRLRYYRSEMGWFLQL